MSKLSTGKELVYPMFSNVATLKEVRDNEVKMNYCSDFLTKDEFVESIKIFTEERPSLLIDIKDGGRGRADEVNASKMFNFICNRNKVYKFFNKYTTMLEEQEIKFMKCAYTPLEDITSEGKLLQILKLIFDEKELYNSVEKYVANKILKPPYMPFNRFVANDYVLRDYAYKLVSGDNLGLDNLLKAIENILKDNDLNYNVNYRDYIKTNRFALIAYLVSKFIDVKLEDSGCIQSESIEEFNSYIVKDRERYKDFAKILLRVIKGKSYSNIENQLNEFINENVNYYPVAIGRYLCRLDLDIDILHDFIVELESPKEDIPSKSDAQDLDTRINKVYTGIPESQREFLEGDSTLEKILDYMERYVVD